MSYFKDVKWTDVSQLPKDRGIIKVNVTPPKNLYVPVLPIRFDKKLLFVLCKECATKYSGKEGLSRDLTCSHCQEKRSFTTTTTTHELLKSVEKGYTVNYVFDAYFWDKWSNNLFKSFIKTLLKIKLEASGPPADVEDLDGYLEEIKKRYGFDLDKTKWMKNEGMRTIAKLL